MASDTKMQTGVDDGDDDDELEALRRAALQTLGCNKTQPVQQQILSMGPVLPNPDFRGGMHRSRLPRNAVFQRHRVNSNLIAIVPAAEDSPPTNNSTSSPASNQRVKSGASVADVSTPKLVLPQHRYCKSPDQQEVSGEPTVSTKFNRFDDSDSESESSAEESDEDSSSGEKVSLKLDNIDPDPDILLMEDDDEDSLEKLMDQLEQEMNETNENKIADNKKCSVTLSSQNVLKVNSKTPKVSANVSCSTVKKKTNENRETLQPHVLTSSHPAEETASHNSSKKVISLGSDSTNVSSTKPCSYLPKSAKLGHKGPNVMLPKSPTVYHPTSKLSISSRQNMSPPHRKRSKSKSPSRSPVKISKTVQKIRKSRSISPRPKSYYSPLRSPEHSRSPGRSRSRNRTSRSPVRLLRSPRSPRLSRSPLRNSRSPRRKYSRSPPIHYVSLRIQGPFSPRRQSQSPRPRRPLTPRRSVSPRTRKLSPRRPVSPRRSPVSSRWLSPRRQSLSPRFRRQSVSPAPRHPVSSRLRRSISPRRQSPLSFRRKLSPSPARRNQSPLHRFSPPRRNPSPPRRRSSRSLSRSPDRVFADRRRSPGRGRSPILIRAPHRSPSPRRRTSRSPISRSGIRRVSPVRKSSPWSPPRQQVTPVRSPNNRRFSTSPSRRKSLSPYGRQRRRSNSPVRRLPQDKSQIYNRVPPRSDARLQHSPRRDVRRPLQESRLNNMRTRSRSPRPNQGSSNRCTHSPRLSHSPRRKSWSCTSSLSLSPSPERNVTDDPHRYKSPLRLRTDGLEFRNSSASALTCREESSSSRQHITASPVPAAEDVVQKNQLKNKSSKKKDPRNKIQKKSRCKEKGLNEKVSVTRSSPFTVGSVKTSDSRIRAIQKTSETLLKTELVGSTSSNSTVMEARRRKFESSDPVESSSKRIKLKPVISKETNEDRPKATSNPSELVISETVYNKTRDDLEDLDLELENAVDLWSSDECDSDNEGRFKTSVRSGTAPSETTKAGIVSFTKLLLPTSPMQTSNKREEKAVVRPSKDTSRYKTTRNVERGVRIKDQQTTSFGREAFREARDQKTKIHLLQNRLQDRINRNRRTEDKKGKRVKTLKLDVAVESTTNDLKSIKCEASSTGLLHDVEDKSTDKVIESSRGKEGDLRAELSRRRAERLTKAGSVHESLPARLVQSAFKDAVGKKIFKRLDRGDVRANAKRAESNKGSAKTDGRRVLVLKSTTVERHIPHISVTIPKGSKCKGASSPPAKLPIHMRLGLTSAKAIPEEREHPSSRRRGSRKVKLKRNVTVAAGDGDKIFIY